MKVIMLCTVKFSKVEEILESDPIVIHPVRRLGPSDSSWAEFPSKNPQMQQQFRKTNPLPESVLLSQDTSTGC